MRGLSRNTISPASEATPILAGPIRQPRRREARRGPAAISCRMESHPPRPLARPLRTALEPGRHVTRLPGAALKSKERAVWIERVIAAQERRIRSIEERCAQLTGQVAAANERANGAYKVADAAWREVHY